MDDARFLNDDSTRGGSTYDDFESEDDFNGASFDDEISLDASESGDDFSATSRFLDDDSTQGGGGRDNFKSEDDFSRASFDVDSNQDSSGSGDDSSATSAGMNFGSSIAAEVEDEDGVEAEEEDIFADFDWDGFDFDIDFGLFPLYRNVDYDGRLPAKIRGNDASLSADVRIYGCSELVDVFALADALKHNQTIRSLEFNPDTSDVRACGATAIANVLKSNSTIQNITLLKNTVTDKGAVALGKSLRLNDTLKTLDLECADIGDGGVTSIAFGLRDNKVLQMLYPGDNSRIGRRGVVALATTLFHNTSIIRLGIDSANVTEVGAKALVAATAVNTTLAFIHLPNGSLIDDNGLVIIEGFMRCKQKDQVGEEEATKLARDLLQYSHHLPVSIFDFVAAAGRASSAVETKGEFHVQIDTDGGDTRRVLSCKRRSQRSILRAVYEVGQSHDGERTAGVENGKVCLFY